MDGRGEWGGGGEEGRGGALLVVLYRGFLLDAFFVCLE